MASNLSLIKQVLINKALQKMPYHELTYRVDVIWQPMSSEHQSNNKQYLRCFPVFEAIYIRLVGIKYSLVVELYLHLSKADFAQVVTFCRGCEIIYCYLTIIKRF